MESGGEIGEGRLQGVKRLNKINTANTISHQPKQADSIRVLVRMH